LHSWRSNADQSGSWRVEARGRVVNGVAIRRRGAFELVGLRGCGVARDDHTPAAEYMAKILQILQFCIIWCAGRLFTLGIITAKTFYLIIRSLI